MTCLPVMSVPSPIGHRSPNHGNDGMARISKFNSNGVMVMPSLKPRGVPLVHPGV